MEHREWIAYITDHDSERAIGRRADISYRTINNQIERNNISAENVIKIALAYGKHPVTALIDCGYLPAAYAVTADPLAALKEVSEDDLADEVLRRMKIVGDHTTLHTPVDELAKRRSNTVTPDVSPIHEDESDAASTAPLEPEEGDDDHHGGA